MHINAKIKMYLLYIKQCKELDAIYDLDHNEMQLLNEIALAMIAENKLTVSKALEFKNIASPATIHAAMKRLIAKQLVLQVPSEKGRMKYLQLTKLGLKRYSELSEIMISSNK
jgi:DNA-binding MarR family transcriptional regulator